MEIYEYIFASKEKYIIGVMLVAVDIGLSVCIGEAGRNRFINSELLIIEKDPLQSGNL